MFINSSFSTRASIQTLLQFSSGDSRSHSDSRNASGVRGVQAQQTGARPHKAYQVSCHRCSCKQPGARAARPLGHPTATSLIRVTKGKLYEPAAAAVKSSAGSSSSSYTARCCSSVTQTTASLGDPAAPLVGPCLPPCRACQRPSSARRSRDAGGRVFCRRPRWQDAESGT